METSLIFTLIGLIISVGTALFSVGVYFGYVKGKFSVYDELAVDFYKHAGDENKHFSARDWKHLNDTLEELKRSVDELKTALSK